MFKEKILKTLTDEINSYIQKLDIEKQLFVLNKLNDTSNFEELVRLIKNLENNFRPYTKFVAYQFSPINIPIDLFAPETFAFQSTEEIIDKKISDLKIELDIEDDSKVDIYKNLVINFTSILYLLCLTHLLLSKIYREIKKILILGLIENCEDLINQFTFSSIMDLLKTGEYIVSALYDFANDIEILHRINIPDSVFSSVGHTNVTNGETTNGETNKNKEKSIGSTNIGSINIKDIRINLNSRASISQIITLFTALADDTTNIFSEINATRSTIGILVKQKINKILAENFNLIRKPKIFLVDEITITNVFHSYLSGELLYYDVLMPQQETKKRLYTSITSSQHKVFNETIFESENIYTSQDFASTLEQTTQSSNSYARDYTHYLNDFLSFNWDFNSNLSIGQGQGQGQPGQGKGRKLSIIGGGIDFNMDRDHTTEEGNETTISQNRENSITNITTATSHHINTKEATRTSTINSSVEVATSKQRSESIEVTYKNIYNYSSMVLEFRQRIKKYLQYKSLTNVFFLFSNGTKTKLYINTQNMRELFKGDKEVVDNIIERLNEILQMSLKIRNYRNEIIKIESPSDLITKILNGDEIPDFVRGVVLSIDEFLVKDDGIIPSIQLSEFTMENQAKVMFDLQVSDIQQSINTKRLMNQYYDLSYKTLEQIESMPDRLDFLFKLKHDSDILSRLLVISQLESCNKDRKKNFTLEDLLKKEHDEK